MARARRNRPLRAVVTDVDGTLTDQDRRLDPEAVRWVRRLETRGVPVILATGNVLPIALAIHRSLGLSGPIVAENGGLIYRKVDGTERVERLADRAVALRAFRALRRAGLPVRPLFTDRWREAEVAIETNVSLSAIARELRGTPVRAEGTGYAIHLMQRGAGKRPALARALRPYGWTLADCVVLGDGDNDASMLRAAGFGVSFASGSPAARRAARYVARASFAAGFVEGLKASTVLERRSSLPGGN
jgi:phosphoglycolate phosphatase